MDQQTNKTYAFVGIGIVILAFIAWGAYAYTHRGTPANNSTNTQQTDNTTIPSVASTTPTTGTNLTKLSYGAAVNAYPNRIQFSQCHGTPGAIVAKKGTIIMLDNRDAVAHTFVADSQTFKIAGYDYALLHTSAITNTNITCDGGGAAKLNVEK